MNDKGIPVKIIEQYARKHVNELFFALAILVAAISSILDFFTGPIWTIGFMGLGTILSLAYPQKLLRIEKNILEFMNKQEMFLQIILGSVCLVFAIFLPFIIFFNLGILAGIAYHLIPKVSKEISIREKALGNEEEHP
ncbi:MAG: hypothetical protein WCP39_00025 [Chlamydiota bacterium]